MRRSFDVKEGKFKMKIFCDASGEPGVELSVGEDDV
jgi:hypothetical protein